MKNITKKIAAIALAGGVMLSAAACTGMNSEYQERKDQQASTTLDNSLELNNLEEKRDRENDPTALRYVYLMNYGQIVGYYSITGKVSSSASQLAAEQEIIQPWAGGERYVVDSAKDDGSFGTGDPGIFFFTTEGIMVETSLDYIVSDQVLAIDVPRLEAQ